MAEDVSVCFHGATHVVIETGFAPPLRNLLNIECALREELECDITALFSCDTSWRTGVLVPCPFGFRPLLKPTPHALNPFARTMTDALKRESDSRVSEINGAIDRMLAEAASRPFCEHGRGAIAKQRGLCDQIYCQQYDWHRSLRKSV